MHVLRIMRACTLTWFVVVGGLGCRTANDYVYTPESVNAETAAGLPASRTPIPQESPKGTVEVTSFGITDLKSSNDHMPVIHVRMVVTNDGDVTPWTMDTGEQLLQIPGEGESAPIYVNSDVRTLPNVSIAQHERRVLDFYFPLPATIKSDSQLPAFDLAWKVNTAARTVASSTAFDRVARPEAVAYGDYDVDYWPLWAGYGPYWWYDTYYPGRVFRHPRPIAIHPRPHHPVVVGHFNGHFQPAHHGHG